MYFTRAKVYSTCAPQCKVISWPVSAPKTPKSPKYEVLSILIFALRVLLCKILKNPAQAIINFEILDPNPKSQRTLSNVKSYTIYPSPPQPTQIEAHSCREHC